MAIELKNSMFVHIPKTGGTWAVQMITQAVIGYKTIGDPVYDGHASPDTAKEHVFAFIREPATFARSLWHQRAKVKNNNRGHKWNWQEYLRLESECKSEDYDAFLENCANCENGVAEYYDHYIGKYPNIIVGKQENLADDMIKILDQCGEDYNKPYIIEHANQIVRPGNVNTMEPDIRRRINEANNNFSQQHGYI